jgi:hypothetical protein
MTEVLLSLSQLNLRETILTEMKANRTLNLQLRLCIPRNVEFNKTPPEHHQFNDIGEPHFHPHVTASPSQCCKIQPTLCDLLGNHGSQHKKRRHKHIPRGKSSSSPVLFTFAFSGSASCTTCFFLGAATAAASSFFLFPAMMCTNLD